MGISREFFMIKTNDILTNIKTITKTTTKQKEIINIIIENAFVSAKDIA